MDASFIPIEVVPSKTPFGLDKLQRSYKTALSATDAIAAAPAVGTADETFPNMFLMPITTPESAASATRIDLVYQGVFGGIITLNAPGISYVVGDTLEIASGIQQAAILVNSVGAGNGVATFSVTFNTFTAPYTGLAATNVSGSGLGSGATFNVFPMVLPASQETDDEAVMTASSSKSGTTGITVTSPMTVQFYAPTRTLSYITYNAKGSKDDVSDPDGGPTVITLTVSDTTFTSTSYQVAAIIGAFFSIQTTATLKSQELVPGGKYWLNQAQKTTHFVPFTFDMPPGFYPIPFSGGTGYAPGDTITVTSGGACTMTVQAVYTPGDQIMAVKIVSNGLSVASSTPITASGGSGSGASYTVIHIT